MTHQYKMPPMMTCLTSNESVAHLDDVSATRTVPSAAQLLLSRHTRAPRTPPHIKIALALALLLIAELAYSAHYTFSHY